jgi:hypothetical protein
MSFSKPESYPDTAIADLADTTSLLALVPSSERLAGDPIVREVLAELKNLQNTASRVG